MRTLLAALALLLIPIAARADLVRPKVNVVTNADLEKAVRAAAKGPDGLKGVMADVLKIEWLDEESGKTKTTHNVKKAQVDKKMWDDSLSGLFADLNGGAPIACKQTKKICVVSSNAGPEIQYTFVLAGDSAVLTSIRLPDGE